MQTLAGRSRFDLTPVTGSLLAGGVICLVVPAVAIAVAASAGLNPIVLLTLIGTCISLTFLNPISHQTNMMVMGPGGYSTKTFVRYGIPVTAVCLAVAIATGWILLTR